MEDTLKLFYEHYLSLEKIKRDDALRLLEEKKYVELGRHHVHYHAVSHEHKKLVNHSLSKVIEELQQIQTKLPSNSSNVKLGVIPQREDIFNQTFVVQYRLNSVRSEETCKNLARCWAKDALFKMYNQPAGKDGISAKKLLERLTNNK